MRLIALWILLLLFSVTGCKEQSSGKKQQSEVKKESVAEIKQEAIQTAPEKVINDPFYSDEEQVKKLWSDSLRFFRRNEAADSGLAELNSEYWQLEKVWPKDKNTQEILVSTCDESDRSIWFLTYDDFDYQIISLKRDGRCELKYTLPRLRDNTASCGYNWHLNVENGEVLLYTGNWLWCSVEGKKRLSPIREIPMFPIISAWRNGSGIMVMGKDMLWSCDRYGKNRKVSFSGRQVTKSLELQRENPKGVFVYGTGGKMRDEVLFIFTCGFEKAALYKYDNSTRKTELLTHLPEGEANYFNVLRENGKLNINWALPPPQLDISMQMVWDIEKSSLRVIACKDSDYFRNVSRELADKSEVKLEKPRKVGGRFSLHNGRNMLYYGPAVPFRRMTTPGCAGVVDLRQFPGGAALKYPTVNGLYADDSGNITAVEFNCITKIKPVNRD